MLGFFLQSPLIFAIDISGSVKDSITQEPLFGVHLVLHDSLVATSDINGAFSFSLKKINEGQVLSVSYLGYESKHIPISNSGTEHLNIVLKEISTPLGQVVVS
ncbi:MAG: carboxypeptidase-like regulatory domain-containing protein, partial [Bacteroidetes bacterium]|nr:carboxypeptidase-like regulatory domain-containing protein [Bacteroidota bacterium]